MMHHHDNASPFQQPVAPFALTLSDTASAPLRRMAGTSSRQTLAARAKPTHELADQSFSCTWRR